MHVPSADVACNMARMGMRRRCLHANPPIGSMLPDLITMHLCNIFMDFKL